nr:DUF2516 family protein [Corynebacterium atypicum]
MLLWLAYFQWGLFMLVGVFGLIGAGFATTTREDAFTAADRQQKWVWVGLLLLSAFLVIVNMPFLSWIGIVIIGLYWWDVRPQLNDLIKGAGGW